MLGNHADRGREVSTQRTKEIRVLMYGPNFAR